MSKITNMTSNSKNALPLAAPRICIGNPRVWSLADTNHFAAALAVHLIKQDEPTLIISAGGRPLLYVWFSDDMRLLVRLARSSLFSSDKDIVEVGQIVEQKPLWCLLVNPIGGEGAQFVTVHKSPHSAMVDVCRRFWMRLQMMLEQSQVRTMEGELP